VEPFLSRCVLKRSPNGSPYGRPIIRKEKPMTKTIVTALLLTGSLLVAACNTVEGAGKDVQSAGKAVEKSAN
jgi:predicted small secreted protein